MLQACDVKVFRPIVAAARQGNLKPFGVIQGCLDTGDDERAAALAVLAELGVTVDELSSFTTQFRQHEQEYRQHFMEGGNNL